MSVLPSAPIPAGWYPDPAGSFQQRWWNGTSWTNDFAQYRPTLIHSAPLVETLQAGAEQPGFGEFSVKQNAESARSVGSTATGSTSTLTRAGRSTDPTVEHRPIGLPPEDQAPLTSVARPNAGNAVLVPVAPMGSGAATAEKNAAWGNYEPAAATTSAWKPATDEQLSRRSAQAGGTKRFTLAAWLLALLPAIFLGGAIALAWYVPALYTNAAQLVFGASFLLLGILLAALDRLALSRSGHEFTASPAWGVLTPLSYLSVRAVTVGRETGRNAAAPMILFLVTLVAIGVSLAFVPGLITLLTANALY